ncbi:hypothetical protein [Pseudarthrobacter sp. N5]|uniref:hypothetical protein n=1 Tax=Pseudarthrobacter sp. N5 TaxID=3418416 RepID=UPI003CFA0536
MAEKHGGEQIEPDVASHLAESMDTPQMPEPATVAVAAAMSGGQEWPDGNGKHRHPKDNEAAHGRPGHEAAATAVHRTRRPQMPHSS